MKRRSSTVRSLRAGLWEILSGVRPSRPFWRASPAQFLSQQISPKCVQHPTAASHRFQFSGPAQQTGVTIAAGREPSPTNTGRRQAPAPDLQTCRQRARVTADARVIRASRFQRTRLERRGEIFYS